MDDFARQYFAEECQTTRCVNRRQTLVETGDDLRKAQAMLSQIMQRVKQDNSAAAREIYRAIALFNLGELDPSEKICW
jgi:hypothetical protein